MQVMNEAPSSKRYTINIDLDNTNSSHTLAIDLIGKNKMVLEIGTSTGYMSKLLKERGNQIIGVEIDPEAAEIASQFCELMIIGDVEVLDLDEYLKDVLFDAIILTDIIEHLVWPAKTLEMLKKYLKEDGYLVVSIPNICHGDIILSLMNSNFKYSQMGLLDKTHLRFFGVNNIYDFFSKCGFTVNNLHTTKIPLGCTELKIDLNKVPKELIKFLYSLPNSEVYQFVFCAKLSSDARSGAYLNEFNLITNFNESIQETIDESVTPLLDVQKKLYNQLSVQSQNIRDLENEISDKKSQISDKENQILDKNNQLLNKDNQIQILNKSLKEKIDEISLLENSLSSMRSSVTFRLTSKFDTEFVERLFPGGTRRRSSYYSVIKGGRILVNDGPKSFLKRFPQFISDKKKI